MSLYRDMAKAVHPDRNPDLTGAHEMMQEVNANKSNPGYLLRLAKKWGLDIDTGKFDETVFEARTEEFKREVFEAVVGAIIRFTYGRSRYRKRLGRGVITKVRLVTRGQFKGQTEYTVFNFVTRKVHKFKGWCDKDMFSVVGMAHEMDLVDANQAIVAKKENAKYMKSLKENTARSYFDAAGLEPNTNYEGSGLFIKTFTRYGDHEVIKTTAQQVFIKDRYGGVYRLKYNNIWGKPFKK